MGRCLVNVGCLCSFLLFAVGMASLAVFLVLPTMERFEENASLDRLYQTLLCREDETVRREPYTWVDYEGASNHSLEVYCSKDGVERDVTHRWRNIGILSFLLPFMLGLLGGIISLALRSPYGLDSVTPLLRRPKAPIHVDLSKREGHPIVSPYTKTLKEKLSQVEEAYQAGLLSKEEYQRVRQNLLDDLKGDV